MTIGTMAFDMTLARIREFVQLPACGVLSKPFSKSDKTRIMRNPTGNRGSLMPCFFVPLSHAS